MLLPSSTRPAQRCLTPALPCPALSRRPGLPSPGTQMAFGDLLTAHPSWRAHGCFVCGECPLRWVRDGSAMVTDSRCPCWVVRVRWGLGLCDGWGRGSPDTASPALPPPVGPPAAAPRSLSPSPPLPRMASAIVVSASASYYMAAMGPGGGGGGGTTATRAISKARDVVAEGKSKGKGPGPGLAVFVREVPLCPPPTPPPHRR